MRLLEIIKLMTAALSSALIASYGYAQNHCDMNDFSNPGIITCSQESFERIDKVLNEQYKFLIREMPVPLVAQLKSTQRDWVEFKEGYCGDVYDSVFPGREASIEKISCLQRATSSRLNELLYLRTGVIADGFHKAAAIVSQKITDYNYQAAVEFLGERRNLGKLWENYASKNCKVTQELYKEDYLLCMARMRFQVPTT
jgi:uncharacterized protein YecT (DUF1311 family)